MKNNNQKQPKGSLPEKIKQNPELQEIIDKLKKSSSDHGGGTKPSEIEKKPVEPKWR